MQEKNFGEIKQVAINKLTEIYSAIDNFLNNGEDSFRKTKRELENFVIEEEEIGNTNIAKTEQSFIDTLNSVSSSLNSINGMILAVKEMSNNGIPFKTEVEYAKKPSLEYNSLSSVKLWSSFKNNDYAHAQLVDVFDNVYNYETNNGGLFYVELVKSEADQKPSYRQDFNIPPYQKDNKTIFLLLSSNFKIKDMDDNEIKTDYKIKNLRTIYNGEEKKDMIFVSKNNNNVLCANVIFDVFYPESDNESDGYPKEYFNLTVNLNYDIDNDSYSIRVLSK